MPGFLGLTAFYSLSLFTFSGIWVPRWSLSRGFDSVLNDVIATGCDHCFVQVFALGESYCPSRYAPYHNLFSSDDLRRFLQNAHRHNIKVHAWFNLFYIASYNNPPVDPGHPFNCRPDWFVWDYHGQSILGFSASEIKRLGLEGYYLAPANYWVREYLKSIILEVITNFDFDGVHLDYVRYPSKEFTLDPA
ncbi:MAG: family 10 glycosylhydrolase, partial [candidate division WOR-3 bacterium]